MKQPTQSEVPVNESKHTPGTWKVIEPYLGCPRIAVQDDELNVIVAHIQTDEGKETAEANAQRIVTAVNAYQEMKDYIDYVEDKNGMNEMPFTFEQWKQANIDMAD